MKISLALKRTVSFIAAVGPMLMQSLSAHVPSEPFQDCHGIQSTIQRMGTRLTRDLRQSDDELASLGISVSAANEKNSPALISRSQSYNPAAEFLKIGLNFDSTSIKDVLRTALVPPNASGFAGPEQYILSCNQLIQSFDRKTGLPDGVINCTQNYFFGIDSISDPHVLYDHFAKVWYVVAMNFVGSIASDILLAVSHDCVISDCTKWDFYKFPAELFAPGYGAVVDYPLMSFDSEAAYMAIDMFNPGFLGCSLMVLQKETLLKGNPLVTIFPLVNSNPSDSSDIQLFLLPAINYDLHPKYGYFIHRVLSFGGTYSDLHLVRIANPGSSQPTLEPPVAVPVAPYEAFLGFISAPMAGDVFPLALNELQFPPPATSVVVRCGQLYCSFSASANAAGTPTTNPDRLGIYWYQIDLDERNLISQPFTVQSGVIRDTAPTNPQNYIIPSTAVNKFGDLVIAGTVFGPNTFTNVFYSARKKTDPLNTLRNPVLVTNNTSNPYNFGPLTSTGDGQRWGDMSSIYSDPCNEGNFWLTVMYAGLVNGWSIRTTELIRTNK